MRRTIMLLGVLIFFCFSPATAQTALTSLDECIRQGVGQSLRLQAGRLEQDEARADIDIARRLFIPQFQADLSTSDHLKKREYRMGITKLLPDGTRAQAQIKGQAFDTDTANHDRRFAVSLTRPLLRNFGHQITGLDIDLSKLDYQIAIELFKSELNSYIAELASAYFDLAFARKNLEVTEQSLTRARQQFEDTRRDIEAGAIPGQELFVVEENVVEFEIRLENAHRDIAWYELELQKLMNAQTASPTTIVPGDNFEAHLPDPAHFDDSWQQLVTLNPSYKVKELYFRRAGINHELFVNQLKPILDLNLEADAREGGRTVGRNTYQVGLHYEVPLDWKSDRARVSKSRLTIRRQETRFADAESNFRHQLRQTLLDLEHLKSVFTARRRARELSQKKLDAEQEKYKNGISTLTDVVRFQKDLENAELEVIRVLISWNRQRIRKLLLEGSLYKSFGLEIPS
jgi:outer membrane protein TolC